jgi:hypothetical protein
MSHPKYRAATSVAFTAAIFLSSLSLAVAKSPVRAQTTAITIAPTLDNQFLVNPDKGYVQYCMSPGHAFNFAHFHFDPETSVGYSRLEWSEVEPKEGKFDWNKIDNLIAECAKNGRKAAFGVMNVSTGDGDEYVTPKWVFDDGAASLAIPDTSTPTGTQIIPKRWDDPIFLRKMQNFIAALGRRYDGNPHIQFVDIRAYGNWGEGHTGGLGNNTDIILTPSENLEANYFEPYFKAFPNTQLIVPFGSHKYDKVYDWAVSQTAGMRRDGILSQWSKDGSECIRAFGHAPAVFEYCYSYAETKKDGFWSTDSLSRYIEGGKPTFMQWDKQIYDKNTDFMLKLGNKIGYHFVLQKAVLPTHLRPQVPAPLRLTWLNNGIAPLYGACFVAAALLDDKGNVVEKHWLNECHPQSWEPGITVTVHGTVEFGPHPAGLYQTKTDSQPTFQLGITGKTATNWYPLTMVKLSK